MYYFFRSGLWSIHTFVFLFFLNIISLQVLSKPMATSISILNVHADHKKDRSILRIALGDHLLKPLKKFQAKSLNVEFVENPLGVKLRFPQSLNSKVTSEDLQRKLKSNQWIKKSWIQFEPQMKAISMNIMFSKPMKIKSYTMANVQMNEEIYLEMELIKKQ